MTIFDVCSEFLTEDNSLYAVMHSRLRLSKSLSVYSCYFCMVESPDTKYSQVHTVTHHPAWQNEVRSVFQTRLCDLGYSSWPVTETCFNSHMSGAQEEISNGWAWKKMIENFPNLQLDQVGLKMPCYNNESFIIPLQSSLVFRVSRGSEGEWWQHHCDSAECVGSHLGVIHC